MKHLLFLINNLYQPFFASLILSKLNRFFLFEEHERNQAYASEAYKHGNKNMNLR